MQLQQQHQQQRSSRPPCLSGGRRRAVARPAGQALGLRGGKRRPHRVPSETGGLLESVCWVLWACLQMFVLLTALRRLC